jgi:hypothetical protein
MEVTRILAQEQKKRRHMALNPQRALINLGNGKKCRRRKLGV